MAFENKAVAGTTLVYPAIRSPNYAAGSTGWSINADGSAEFNNVTVRGDLVAGSPPTYYAVLRTPNVPAELVTFYTATAGVPTVAMVSYTDSTGPDYYYEVVIPNNSGTLIGSHAAGMVSNGTVHELWRSDINTLVGYTTQVWGVSGSAAAPLPVKVLVNSGSATAVGNGSALELANFTGFTIGAISQPRGLAGITILTASSASVTAETTVASFSISMLEGRAYSVRFGGRVDTSNASGRPRCRLHQTNAAGTLLGDYGGWTTNATAGEDQAACNETILRRTASGTLNDTLCLTLENLSGGANTARLVASATNPFFFGAWDIGDAADYPGAAAVT